MQQHPVSTRADGAQRRPVGSPHAQQRAVLAVRGHGDISIQGGEQRPARPRSLPAHGQGREIVMVHQVSEPDLHEPGHPWHRADPEHVRGPVRVGITGQAPQQACVREPHQAGPGNREAHGQPHFRADEHAAQYTGTAVPGTGTKVLLQAREKAPQPTGVHHASSRQIPLLVRIVTRCSLCG